MTTYDDGFSGQDKIICPLRHAIIPGPPDINPHKVTIQFRDMPCLQKRCAWHVDKLNACAISIISSALGSLAHKHGA